MKKLGMVICLGISLSVANAGPRKAVKNAAGQVKIGVVHVKDVVKNNVLNSSGGIVALYDRTKKRLSVVATGNYAVNLYSALAKTSTDAARTYLGGRKGLESQALVLAGDSVNWAVRTSLGIPADLLENVPGVGVFVADLSKAVNKFTNSLTSGGKKVGLHVLNHGYGLLNDTVNLLEEVATLQDCPVYLAGKFVYDIPGKVLGLIGVPRYRRE